MALIDTVRLLEQDPVGLHVLYPPADSGALKALDKILETVPGRRLPRSFRNFLNLTNGALLFGQERILGAGDPAESPAPDTSLQYWLEVLKGEGAPGWLIPFAPTADGVDCFDTRGKPIEGEWPIVFFSDGEVSEESSHEAFDEWLFDLTESLREGVSMPAPSHVRDEATDEQ